LFVEAGKESAADHSGGYKRVVSVGDRTDNICIKEEGDCIKDVQNALIIRSWEALVRDPNSHKGTAWMVMVRVVEHTAY
jgi:hypothetical protein